MYVYVHIYIYTCKCNRRDVNPLTNILYGESVTAFSILVRGVTTFGKFHTEMVQGSIVRQL